MSWYFTSNERDGGLTSVGPARPLETQGQASAGRRATSQTRDFPFNDENLTLIELTTHALLKAPKHRARLCSIGSEHTIQNDLVTEDRASNAP
jgi:hypothetical protein